MVEESSRVEVNVLGKMLIVIGALTVLVGAALVWAERSGLGSLPGDLVWRRGNWTIYVPLGLVIVLSLLLTLLLNLFFRR
jgi:low affinity Fe/Cu permease